MTKEDLIKYKQKLAKLSEEEKKLRDLHLRQLANGEKMGPMVGYPSIDKPWLKYYDESALTNVMPNTSLYDFLYMSNVNNMDSIALNYLGKKITYRELFKNIDKYSVALKNCGIKENDVVGICMPTTPEAVYLFYAVNKIGAVSNLIDLRKSSEELKYCINIGNTKILFFYNGISDKIFSLINETNCESMVKISAIESLNVVIKSVLKISNITKKEEKYLGPKKLMNLKEFINLNSISDNEFDNNEPVYHKNKLSFIEYTSGSTGLPKVVELPNEVANSRVFQYMNNGMNYIVGDKYLDIIPIFIAFGAVVGIHLPLSMGMEDQIIPAFDYKKIYNLMKKYKPNHLTLTPTSFVELVHSENLEKLNLSNVKTWGCGGDGMTANEEYIVTEALRKSGSKCNVSCGYGGSEIGAPFCTQKDGANKYGSVGIPLPGNNIHILDPITKNELQYGDIGSICMCVDYPMLKYRDNQELTKETLVNLPNGEIGIILNDAGYVDKDGFIFVKGRYNDAIDYNQKKLWPNDIENLIMSTKKVKNCAVTGTNNGNEFIINIVPEKNVNLDNLQLIIDKLFVDNNIINVNYQYNYFDELPLTGSGKIDRKILKDKSLEKILKK